MTPQDFQKKAVGTRVKRVIPPVKESYQYEKQAMFVDAGLFMGRSFRCGWGPGWTLAHCGEVIKPVTKGRYCKTCVKQPLKNRQKKDLNYKCQLNEGRKYCRMLGALSDNCS